MRVASNSPVITVVLSCIRPWVAYIDIIIRDSTVKKNSEIATLQRRSNGNAKPKTKIRRATSSKLHPW